MPGDLNSNQVSRLAGVSLRQLQWWDERGIVSVRINRHCRVYDNEDVLKIRLVAALRKKGLSLQSIRKMLLHDLITAVSSNRYIVVQLRHNGRRPLVKSFETPTSAFTFGSKSEWPCALLSLEEIQ